MQSVASQTPNYNFTTGVVPDDLVEPEHHNRIADTVDRAVGETLKHLLTAGAHEGWEITQEAQVAAGEGLIASCWCRTAQVQSIESLTNGAVNYVYGVTDVTSAPSGTVRFVAQLAPPGPGNAIFLGTIELDADGGVISYDNNAPGVQRSCHQLAINKLEGEGIVEDVPAGGTVSVLVSHQSLGEFRVPGDLRVDSAQSDFEWRVTEHHRGDRFGLEVTNLGNQAADFAYTWSREGLAR